MHAGTRLQEGVGEIQVRSRFLLHQHLDEDKEARDQHSHLLVRTRGRTHIFRFKEGVVNHGGFGNTETKSGLQTLGHCLSSTDPALQLKLTAATHWRPYDTFRAFFRGTVLQTVRKAPYAVKRDTKANVSALQFREQVGGDFLPQHK